MLDQKSTNDAIQVFCSVETNRAFETIQFWVTAALNVVSIIVLAITWRAVLKQAEAAMDQANAARSLTEISKAQTKAAQDAAQLAREANALTQRQIVGQGTPILVLLRDPASSISSLANAVPYLIQNQGPGAAKNVSWHYVASAIRMPNEAITNTLIGAGHSAKLALDQDRLFDDGVVIHYDSLDDRSFITTVSNNEGTVFHDYKEIAKSDS